MEKRSNPYGAAGQAAKRCSLHGTATLVRRAMGFYGRCTVLTAAAVGTAVLVLLPVLVLRSDPAATTRGQLPGATAGARQSKTDAPSALVPALPTELLHVAGATRSTTQEQWRQLTQAPNTSPTRTNQTSNRRNHKRKQKNRRNRNKNRNKSLARNDLANFKRKNFERSFTSANRETPAKVAVRIGGDVLVADVSLPLVTAHFTADPSVGISCTMSVFRHSTTCACEFGHVQGGCGGTSAGRTCRLGWVH